LPHVSQITGGGGPGRSTISVKSVLNGSDNRFDLKLSALCLPWNCLRGRLLIRVYPIVLHRPPALGTAQAEPRGNPPDGPGRLLPRAGSQRQLGSFFSRLLKTVWVHPELAKAERGEAENGSEDFEAAGGGVLLECGDGLRVVTEEFFNDVGGLIATAKPNDFGRSAIQSGHDGKIGVLGHQRDALALACCQTMVSSAGPCQASEPHWSRERARRSLPLASVLWPKSLRIGIAKFAFHA
jgi:hypothetical protein